MVHSISHALLWLPCLLGTQVWADSLLRRKNRALAGLVEVQPKQPEASEWKSASEEQLPIDCNHPIFGRLLCAQRELELFLSMSLSMSFPYEPTSAPTTTPPVQTPAPVQTDPPVQTPAPVQTDAPVQTEPPTMSAIPTDEPTESSAPSNAPTVTATPTDAPTVTAMPTDAPTVTATPTDAPTVTAMPTDSPVGPTSSPSLAPTAGCEVQDREAALTSTLANYVDTSLLSDPTTPQGAAFAWLLSTDTETDPCDALAVSQRYALATFFYSTNGDSWVVNDGWLSSSSVCDWFEVDCLPDNATVSQIDMFDNNLSGALPAELGAVKSMRGFNVFKNRLTGPIPDLFSTWPDLVLFDVENNTLTGDPFVWLDVPLNFTLLPQLRFFRTSFNAGLSGSLTPAAAAQLSGVEQLWLAGCSFSGPLPTELGMFLQLKELFLYNNSFTGVIPDVFGGLDLEEIQLQDNALVGTIPPSLYSNTNLEKIRLDQNDLTGVISPAIGDLTSLVDVRLSFNSFAGSIPSTFAALTNLETFAVRENAFTGPIRDTFANFQSLIRADFTSNQFTGPLPSSIFDLPEIRLLYFGENTLTGSIPENFGRPEFLRDLYLYNNTLTGRVPDIQPGQLQVFTEFRIEYNDITGTMPASICALRGENRTDELVTLRSDCAGDPPEIRCDCCTACF